MGESVLCLKTEYMGKVFPGFDPRSVRYRWGDCEAMARLFELPPEAFVVRERPEVETDDTVKQLVTYCPVHRYGKIMTYRRPTKGGEERLHELRSLGVGGHVSGVEDGGCRIPVFMSALRELQEELKRDSDDHVWVSDNSLIQVPRGLIYDPTNPVGRVHLGVVFSCYFREDADFSLDPASLEDVRYQSLSQIMSSASDYESWSAKVAVELT